MNSNKVIKVIVNQKLAGSIQYIRAYRSAVIDVKSKYRHLIMFRINLKLKSRMGNCIAGSYDVGRFQDKILRETLQK